MTNRQNEFSPRERIAVNLNDYMRLKGVTQVQCAEATGLSTSALSAYCKGVRFPRIEQLMVLAKYLDVKVGDLIDAPVEQYDSIREADQEAAELARDFGKLDEHGRKIVRLILDAELDRCMENE